MVTEKFVGCNVPSRSAGGVILPVELRPRAKKLGLNDVDRAVFTDAEGIHRSQLLAHDHAQPAAPAFRKPHAHDLKFRREAIQEMVRCRMESQRRRDEINKWRSLLQGDSWEIAIASDLSALQLPANAQPVIRSLKRQVNVLAGLQFNDRQLSQSRHGEEVENAVFAARIGKNLSVDESLVEHGVDARNVLAHNGFQPALRLSAEKRMARVVGQRVTVHFQVLQKTLQSRSRSGSELFAGIVDSKIDAAIIPAGKGYPTKPQPHFVGPC